MGAKRPTILKRGAQLGRKAERGALPSPVATPPAQPPQELETIWEDEIREAWEALTERHRRFLLVYLRTGNGSEAYRQVYNPAATDHQASSSASQILSSIGMERILSKYADTRFADLLFVKRGFKEMAEAYKPQWQQDQNGQWENAGDVPDWRARKDGLDGLARVQGLYAPTESNVKASIQSQVLIVELPNKVRTQGGEAA